MIFLLSLLGAVATAEPSETCPSTYLDHDTTAMQEELSSLLTLREKMEKRISRLNRGLNRWERGSLGVFPSGFLTLGVIRGPVRDADPLRVLLKRGGYETFIFASFESEIVVLDANGIELSRFPNGGDADVISVRTGGLQHAPFVVTLDENGLVKLHALRFKRENDFEQTSFWRDEEDWKRASKNDEIRPQVVVKPEFKVFDELPPIAAIETYVLNNKPMVAMGGRSEGQLFLVDVAHNMNTTITVPLLEHDFAQQPGKNAAVGMVNHIFISQSHLAASIDSLEIRFVMLGSNRLWPSANCVLPPNSGAIVSATWTEHVVGMPDSRDKAKYLLVATSQKDLYVFDRRGSVKMKTNGPAQQTRGFVANLFGNAPGFKPGCVVVKRQYDFEATQVVSLPLGRFIMNSPIRGPEIINNFDFTATHAMEQAQVESWVGSIIRRKDFQYLSNAPVNADFAIVMFKPMTEMQEPTGFVYASLYTSTVPGAVSSSVSHETLGPSSGAGGIFGGLFNDGIDVIRGPLLLVLAAMGLFMGWKRRSSSSTGGARGFGGTGKKGRDFRGANSAPRRVDGMLTSAQVEERFAALRGGGDGNSAYAPHRGTVPAGFDDNGE